MTSELSPVALALGRIPTGLYIVTTRNAAGPLGLVGSFVMQVGFEPPAVCVALGRNRDHLQAIRESRVFGLSVLDKESSKLMGAFFKKYPDGESALDHVDAVQTPGGVHVLSGALAWMECGLTGEHDVGDHVVVFGTVRHGELVREGEPSIHTRTNGLAY